MEQRRVLIAEDDHDLRRVLRDEFADRGAHVAEADSGLELTRLLKEDGPFDLVVSDVRMSWASGAQVLAAAREAGLATPFIVITGHRDEKLRKSVEGLGARFFYKPLTFEKLFEAARELLSRRPPHPTDLTRNLRRAVA